MAEYIDKAALVSEIEKNKLMAREPAVRRILELIRNMTVFVGVGLNENVAPVRHGTWKIGRGNDNFDIKCSECGYTDIFGVCGVHEVKIVAKSVHYCPNCGAKMDGGAGNDD